MSHGAAVDERRVHDAIIDVFAAFLGGDEALKAGIESFGRSFRIRQGAWHFQVPDLHEFMRRRDAAVGRLDYDAFRRVLYRLPINRQLAGRAAQVVVETSAGNVNENVYALRPTSRLRRPDQA